MVMLAAGVASAAVVVGIACLRGAAAHFLACSAFAASAAGGRGLVVFRRAASHLVVHARAAGHSVLVLSGSVFVHATAFHAIVHGGMVGAHVFAARAGGLGFGRGGLLLRRRSGVRGGGGLRPAHHVEGQKDREQFRFHDDLLISSW